MISRENLLEEQLREKYIEIERLNENNQHMQEEMARTWEKYDNLQERINKAIEYIDNDFNRFNCFGHLSVAMEMTYKKEELLDILKGSDTNG